MRNECEYGSMIPADNRSVIFAVLAAPDAVHASFDCEGEPAFEMHAELGRDKAGHILISLRCSVECVQVAILLVWYIHIAVC